MASDRDPLITLTEARAFIAAEYGREISRPTLKRWAKRGVRGRRLSHRIIGDWYYTRRSWVRQFVEGARPVDREPAVSRMDPEDLQRMEDATASLEREGFLRGYSKDKMCRVRPSREGAGTLHVGLQGSPLRDCEGQDAGRASGH